MRVFGGVEQLWRRRLSSSWPPPGDRPLAVFGRVKKLLVSAAALWMYFVVEMLYFMSGEIRVVYILLSDGR